MPEGHIRGLSQFYVGGLERMEILINKNNAHLIPYQDNLRIPIRLRACNEFYDAGIRTTPNVNVVWVCPDLRNSRGEKISLARVLINNGFKQNQTVALNVNGDVVRFSPLP